MTEATADLTIAIDVGGTNTDAVCMDTADRILARHKQPTTARVDDGLGAALQTILDELGDRAGRVGRVMLGTTHATNAILERRGLARLGVIRIGAPATTEVPPLTGWPDDLRRAVCADAVIIGGGHLVDGLELSRLDLAALDRFIDTVAEQADGFAVTGVFSPAIADHELRVAERIRERVGVDASISVSHEVGSLGLLERENATVLNAALRPVAGAVIDALSSVIEAHGLEVATFFAQNDGTLMALEHASRFPVLTIGSGPANSLRGAARLSGESEAIVADVGGTSTDFGVLAGGFPRESTLATEIGGVRTNFRMPDIHAVALGGGTIISTVGGRSQLGPRSVGYKITTEALCFGGATATLTDAALALGRGSLPGITAPRLDGDRGTAFAAALEQADQILEHAVDRVSLGRFDKPLIAVGGGSFLIPEKVPGASRVIHPADADVANAVGAAIAPVSGRAETLASSIDDRRQAIDRASELASDRAIQAGARPGSVEIVEIVETPLTYLPQPSVRVTVKAAGTLGWL
ncbi:hydantoinase/oxoprolinase family protein [Microlunatus sp. GCM10028923]|uniref:hydantoinase/oxoprolinase family protein n=1 Tax=Microlunatus sp. GCM10028923 TaxID=3273400 RepID=UPI0036192500